MFIPANKTHLARALKIWKALGGSVALVQIVFKNKANIEPKGQVIKSDIY